MIDLRKKLTGLLPTEARAQLQNVLTVEWAGHKTVLVAVPEAGGASDDVELEDRARGEYGRLLDDEDSPSPALRPPLPRNTSAASSHSSLSISKSLPALPPRAVDPFADDAFLDELEASGASGASGAGGAGQAGQAGHAGQVGQAGLARLHSGAYGAYAPADAQSSRARSAWVNGGAAGTGAGAAARGRGLDLGLDDLAGRRPARAIDALDTAEFGVRAAGPTPVTGVGAGARGLGGSASAPTSAVGRRPLAADEWVWSDRPASAASARIDLSARLPQIGRQSPATAASMGSGASRRSLTGSNNPFRQ
ncbi:hypothetical protein Q5752_004471 [Cryptotrichosporon argae]